MTAATNTSGNPPFSRRTGSAEETVGLAERIGRRLTGGEVLALVGLLGAGKTWFAKGIAKGLGIDPRDVTSPTFLLIHELEGRLPFRHLDAYRVSGGAELAELGADEMLSGGREGDPVVLVEWADRVSDLLPPERLDVVIEHAGETERRLAFRARGERHERLLVAVEEIAG